MSNEDKTGRGSDSSAPSERIGFVGLGSMGVGMAANVVAAGYPLTVLGHRRREPVERLLALGATEVATPRELAAASDIVIACVTTSDAVEALVDGEEGLLSHPEADFLLIDCGTSRPESTVSLGEKLAARGCTMLDVPLGKSSAAAESGTLNMMAGGTAANFERARPVLETMSENLFHVGALGVGHRLKLINNAYSLSIACLAAQAVTVAKAGGVDVDLLYKVMAAGPNRSDFFDWMFAAELENDETRLAFSIENGCKDIGYFDDMSQSLGTHASLPAEARVLLEKVVADGHGGEMVPALMRLLAGSTDAVDR